MKIVLIEYSDQPTKARFMDDVDGNRLVFGSHKTANNYLEHNAKTDVYYKHYCFDILST